LVNQEEEYEVEKILDSAYRHGILRYLVKWKGYPNSEATWIRSDETDHMKELVDEWYKGHPEAPRSLRPTTSKPQGPRKRVPKRGKVRFMGMETDGSLQIENIPFKQRDATEVNPIQWPTGRMTVASVSSDGNLDILKLSETAKIPTRSTDLAAGADLYASEETEISPGSHGLVKTGIAIQFPSGMYARIAPRSGLALKNGIAVGAGVIDQDYTGPIGVILFNHGKDTFKVQTGDRVAQLILESIALLPLREVQKLSETKRGNQGFGSTGTR